MRVCAARARETQPGGMTDPTSLDSTLHLLTHSLIYSLRYPRPSRPHSNNNTSCLVYVRRLSVTSEVLIQPRCPGINRQP